MSRTDTPFSDAVESFDPSAEPYANMAPGRIREAMARRLAANDLEGYWVAERHLAAKLPPMERFSHDLGLQLHAWLLELERRGRLPYEGWTLRHLVAVLVHAHRAVEAGVADGTFDGVLPPGSPEASVAVADDVGIVLAHEIARGPSAVERLQAELERDEGGPLVAPG